MGALLFRAFVMVVFPPRPPENRIAAKLLDACKGSRSLEEWSGFILTVTMT
jgi:hypothetical protein